MEFRTFDQIGILSRVTAVSKFTLHTSQNFLIQCRSNHFEISFVEFTNSPEKPKCFSLCRSVIDYPSDWPTEQLKVDKNKFLESLSLDNYVNALIDAKWNSQIYDQKPIISPVRIEVSNHGKILAVLMSNGSFKLYKMDHRNKTWILYYDIALQHLRENNDRSIVKSYEELKEKLEKLQIVFYEWIQSSSGEDALVWVTKGGYLFRGDFQTDQDKLLIITAVEGNIGEPAMIKSLHSDNAFILTSTSGKVQVFHIRNNTVEDLTPIWPECDEILPSCMEVKREKDVLRVFVVKGHHLLIFTLDSDLTMKKLIVEPYNCPLITAFKAINTDEFVIVLSNHKIFHGRIQNNSLESQEVTHDFSPNFTCNGITYLRCLAVWIFSFVASKPHDYTKVKQPEMFVFAHNSKYDGFKQIMNDPLKVPSRYLEYFEMLRRTNTSYESENAQLLKVINFSQESLDSIQFALKIHWFFTSVLITRDPKLAEKEGTKDKVEFLGDILKAIRIFSFAKSLSTSTNHSEKTLLTIQNMVKFLSQILITRTFADYDRLLNKLDSIFRPTITVLKRISPNKLPETCLLCDGEIVQGQLTCVQLHRIKRCCYTLNQIPLMAGERCNICGFQSVDVGEINEILGLDIRTPTCPCCDLEIV